MVKEVDVGVALVNGGGTELHANVQRSYVQTSTLLTSVEVLLASIHGLGSFTLAREEQFSYISSRIRREQADQRGRLSQPPWSLQPR